MRGVLRTMAIVGVGAGLLGGCSVLPRQAYTDQNSVPQRVTSIRLDSEAGDVTVRGANGVAAISVQRKIRYAGGKPSGPTFRVDNGVLVLNGCGVRCSVDYTVTVPAGLPVNGKVTAGDVNLSGVGAVDVTMTAGDLKADGVSGDVKAQSVAGSIDIALASPHGVRAKGVNGDITVTVPAGRYRVTAETTRGDKTLSVPNDPAGPPVIDVRTTNGDVTVR